MLFYVVRMLVGITHSFELIAEGMAPCLKLADLLLKLDAQTAELPDLPLQKRNLGLILLPELEARRNVVECCEQLRVLSLEEGHLRVEIVQAPLVADFFVVALLLADFHFAKHLVRFLYLRLQTDGVQLQLRALGLVLAEFVRQLRIQLLRPLVDILHDVELVSLEQQLLLCFL